MIVIAGAPSAHERTSGFLLHHQARTVDAQLAVFKEITCDQAVLTDPVSAPTQIARVLRSAQRKSARRRHRAGHLRMGWRRRAHPWAVSAPGGGASGASTNSASSMT